MTGHAKRARQAGLAGNTHAATIEQHIARARQQLRDAGIDDDEAAIDARLLAGHVLGWDTARVLTRGADPAPLEFAARFEAVIARRATREPVAYITGVKDFWTLSFDISPAVLIPRPETEGLIDHALALRPDRQRAWRVADVCTGSGCVGISIAVEYPHARVTATDTSDGALDVARRNAARHQVTDRVALVRDDLLTRETGPFDLILANPPYVKSGDRAGLQPEVTFEPDDALFAGSDGLEVIRRLLGQAAVRLEPGGLLIFEFGYGQDPMIRELISSREDLRMVDIKADFSGIPRIAIAVRC